MAQINLQGSNVSAAGVTISIPVFEGPLELLLQLLRQNQVEIYDIPIAVITAQYLELVRLVQLHNLGELGDYLVMAATLIEIKSRMLLPRPPSVDADDEDDPRAELVARLLEYERVRDSAEYLAECEAARRDLWFRLGGSVVDGWAIPLAQPDADPMTLLKALQRVLARVGIEDRESAPPLTRRRVSLRLKMAEVLQQLESASGSLAFDDLFNVETRIGEIVITFLALLELMRRGRLRAVQRAHDAPIRIRLTPSEERVATH
ncbi:MAG: segregation/condensation protein A [Armatimonadetes bacterium]|nr:segregation/condensation protein A [Armatimonadota bacterium]MDE2205370.1 segregation/condensation protein A [Armatimonadota bacterium]